MEKCLAICCFNKNIYDCVSCSRLIINSFRSKNSMFHKNMFFIVFFFWYFIYNGTTTIFVLKLKLNSLSYQNVINSVIIELNLKWKLNAKIHRC